jgi:hypothetical protein
MLLLPQNGLRPPLLPPNYYFWAVLGTLSTLGHCLVLLFIFLGMPEAPLLINTHQSAPVIVVAPLYKTLLKNSYPLANSAKPVAKPEKVQQIKQESHDKKTVAPKAPAKKPKPVEQKSNKEITKKAEPTPLAQPQKSEPPNRSKMVPEPQPAPEKIQEYAAVQQQNLPSVNADIDDVMYVGRDEIDQIRAQEEVKIGIAKTWKRPAGMSAKVQCQITVTLDKQGNKQICMEKSSGVLVYDTCAKQAVLAYEFPSIVWNKQLVLVM